MQAQRPRFVVDTHTLWWYFKSPAQLSATASAIFRLVELNNAIIVVPAIVVAEFYFLSAKLGQPYTPSDLLKDLDAIGGIELSALARIHLEKLDTFPEIPEMHDKLIAAVSAVLNAPVITRDGALIRSRHVETVW